MHIDFVVHVHTYSYDIYMYIYVRVCECSEFENYFDQLINVTDFLML